jgi:undecaprenyl-diphosphatase
LAIGTIPIAVVGYVFNKDAEGPWRTPWVMGTMLIVVGVLMYFAENAGRKVRDLASVSGPDAITIGLAQALAVVPGTSRSGISISAGLFRNFSSQTAARFSFLLSAPAIAGAAAKAFWEMHKEHQLHQVLEPPFLVGVAVSAVTGCIVIAWFLHYLRRSSLRPFVYYRIIFGIIVLALALMRGQRHEAPISDATQTAQRSHRLPASFARPGDAPESRLVPHSGPVVGHSR